MLKKYCFYDNELVISVYLSVRKLFGNDFS